MPITERRLERSTTLAEAAERFLDSVGDWIDESTADTANHKLNGGRGQLTYTTAWEPYLRARPSPQVLAFLAERRDSVRRHFEAANEWRHGYWRMKDVRHGTEHFALFLGFLARLNPDDAITRTQVLDAAEHVGNWSPDTPAWFEPSSGLFRSLHFGADGVQEQAVGWNMPDHLRCVDICLTAYNLSGENRYIEFARRYAGRWADAILNSGEPPVGLDVSGPFFTIGKMAENAYRSCVNIAGPLNGVLDRAENLLANGSINIFLTLWKHTKEVRFRMATEALLNVLLPQLADPNAGVLADAIRLYRHATGDRRYDEAVRMATSVLAPYDLGAIGVQPNVMRLTRSSGLGKRADMPVWFEDLHLRRHNPVLLALAAEINNDVTLATMALDLGRAYFELARDTLPEGREDGEAANTLCAVARGHGRDNGCGVITAVLGPLLEATIPAQVAANSL